jgi:peptidoglycan hydrolase-like protein with peptidoglycan-binding domain
MTPQHARTAFAVFTLVAGGVTYNALFNQDGTNRKFGDEPSASSAAPVRKERVELPAKRTGAVDLGDATDAASRDTVRAIQRELKKRGSTAVPVDGSLRPVTRAAILAFEHDSGLPLTGEANEDQLKRILMGAAAVPATGKAGEVRSPHAEAVIKMVQRHLGERGYRPGATDGRLNAPTAAAIRQFETDQGMRVMGRISAELLTRLQERAPGPTVNAER